MTPRELILKVAALERDGHALLRLPREEALILLPAWLERHSELFNQPALRPDLNDRLIKIETEIANALS